MRGTVERSALETLERQAPTNRNEPHLLATRQLEKEISYSYLITIPSHHQPRRNHLALGNLGCVLWLPSGVSSTLKDPFTQSLDL